MARRRRRREAGTARSSDGVRARTPSHRPDGARRRREQEEGSGSRIVSRQASDAATKGVILVEGSRGTVALSELFFFLLYFFSSLLHTVVLFYFILFYFILFIASVRRP